MEWEDNSDACIGVEMEESIEGMEDLQTRNADRVDEWIQILQYLP